MSLARASRRARRTARRSPLLARHASTWWCSTEKSATPRLPNSSRKHIGPLFRNVHRRATDGCRACWAASSRVCRPNVTGARSLGSCRITTHLEKLAVRTTIRAIFTPSMTLMGRLNYVEKFVLISVLFAAPLAAVMCAYITDANAQIDFTRSELQGTRYLRPLFTLYADVLQSRYLAKQPQAAGLAAAQTNIRNDCVTQSRRRCHWRQSEHGRGLRGAVARRLNPRDRHAHGRRVRKRRLGHPGADRWGRRHVQPHPRSGVGQLLHHGRCRRGVAKRRGHDESGARPRAGHRAKPGAEGR